jgi:hypothetical protein
MARRVRRWAVGSIAAATFIMIALGGAYYAARQVRPFYEQALQIEPEVLERGSRELESRATALYSDARQHGEWQALFTAEQINCWLASQLAQNKDSALPKNFRDLRVAISRDLLTLGFRTKYGGVETVVSADASVFLTDDGTVAVHMKAVRAGALPLPVTKLADQLAAACEKQSLPVRWTRQDGQPVALVELHSSQSTDKRQFHIDAIELGDGELYVAGHTELGTAHVKSHRTNVATRRESGGNMVKLDDYELRITPRNKRGALQIARRPTSRQAGTTKSSEF